jgi:hypothetical protein
LLRFTLQAQHPQDRFLPVHSLSHCGCKMVWHLPSKNRGLELDTELNQFFPAAFLLCRNRTDCLLHSMSACGTCRFNRSTNLASAVARKNICGASGMSTSWYSGIILSIR